MTASLNTADLLIEFLTEELPPNNLREIGESFANVVYEQLASFNNQNHHNIENDTKEVYVTPRRFGVLIKSVNFTEPVKTKLRKGPAIKTSLVNNTPTDALIGFTKSCGLNNWQELNLADDGYFYAAQIIQGRCLNNVLIDIINLAMKKLPIAKYMRWGNNDFSFVRPVHNLMILFGNKKLTLPNTILGLSVNDYTYGHRTMSLGKIKITTANTYKQQMQEQGCVIVNFDDRLTLIKQKLEENAKGLHLQIDQHSSYHKLLNFITGIIEYPIILQGKFNPNFLSIPQECLISSMVTHQKYFALFNNKDNQLSNQFLFVANLESPNPQVIISGNEKVLAARLNDAQFFYTIDKKHTLNEYVEKLKNVIYHHKLGSQYQRVLRLKYIANQIAPLFEIPSAIATQAAFLAKADLATEMVSEFPELQGIMGKYYALHQGLSSDIASAIEYHYYPRFSGDIIPPNLLSSVVALTDKLEILVGIWSIGLIPTGEKDPFALRRAALGIIRILLFIDQKHIINLKLLLQIVVGAFNDDLHNYSIAANIVEDVYQFLLSRLINYLTSNQYNQDLLNYLPLLSTKNNLNTTNVTNSIGKTNPIYLNRIPVLLHKLGEFATNNNNEALFISNRRIENILKKQSAPQENPEQNLDIIATLLIEPAEKELYQVWMANAHDLATCAIEHNWSGYFTILERFNQPISQFFEHVMVMADDVKIRNNRINLLQNIYNTLNQYCKLSELGNQP